MERVCHKHNKLRVEDEHLPDVHVNQSAYEPRLTKTIHHMRVGLLLESNGLYISASKEHTLTENRIKS